MRKDVKKLVYIANVRMPTEKAHGVQIMNMCHAFSRCGYNVTLLVPRRKTPYMTSPFLYYGVPSTFVIKRIPTIDSVFLGKYGFLLESVVFFIFSRVYYMLQAERGNTIVYTREIGASLLFDNVILELHALPERSSRTHVIAWSRASKIVVLTHAIRRKLEEYGIRPSKIYVAPDAVSLEHFPKGVDVSTSRSELSLPSGFLIGYVGELHTMGKEKGVGVFIEAMQFLKNNMYAVVVGGSTESISAYKEYATHLGVSGRVIFCGRVSHNTVAHYMSACDVLVAPFPDTTHYRLYMSPLKIFEYMASGRPIVTTELPSLREILSDESAIFVAPGDSKDLAQGITRVYRHPEEARRKATRARKDVEKHTWSRRARLISTHW